LPSDWIGGCHIGNWTEDWPKDCWGLKSAAARVHAWRSTSLMRLWSWATRFCQEFEYRPLGSTSAQVLVRGQVRAKISNAQVTLARLIA
jgi:hypothetical protein